MTTRASRWVVAVMVALGSSVAHAQDTGSPDWADKSGAIGVGARTTLAGQNGINVRTYVSPQFGLDLTFGFRLDSASQPGGPGGGDIDTSTTELFARFGGHLAIAHWQRGSLAAELGLAYGTVSTSLNDEDGDSESNFTADVGLRGEYFPTQYLSIFASSGLVLDFLSGEEGEDDVSGFSLDLEGQLFGAAGFTVWFK